MTQTLILSYKAENEFDGELCATVEGGGFRGQGAAWFSLDELHSFCAALGQYPIPKTPPTLNGGYWSGDGGACSQIHMGLTVAPYDIRGNLLVSVQLSEPSLEFDGHDLHRSVSAQFCTDYPSLERFRASFLAVLASEAETAILQGQ